VAKKVSLIGARPNVGGWKRPGRALFCQKRKLVHRVSQGTSDSGRAPPSGSGPSLRAVSYREEAAMSPTEEAFELLLIEEADAWFEYLEATRGQSEIRYKEVEPWAWARLTQRLRAIRARRARLRPAAA
jgi:hypothetical protein